MPRRRDAKCGKNVGCHMYHETWQEMLKGRADLEPLDETVNEKENSCGARDTFFLIFPRFKKKKVVFLQEG